MNIFKANFPIFDLVYGAILIYMAISCLISIMISHFKFLKIIIGQPASHGALLDGDGPNFSKTGDSPSFLTKR